ncbi:MAG: response regulator, partial [Myxococcota bacterium]
LRDDHAGEAIMESPPRARVLLVDDDSRTARLLARMLREDGFDVELAFDGATAIARLSRDPVPAVLLTDFRMPHVDGNAVADYARSRRPNMPIMFVTSYPDLIGAAPCVDVTVIHPKPVDYGRLSLELAGLLDAAE